MNETLTHHGILGMHWGVRRTPTQLGHAPTKSKKTSVKDLSEAELKSRIQRLRMEEEYENYIARANERHRSKVSKLMSKTGQRLSDAAIQSLVNYGMSQVFPKNNNDNSSPFKKYYDLVKNINSAVKED